MVAREENLIQKEKYAVDKFNQDIPNIPKEEEKKTFGCQAVLRSLAFEKSPEVIAEECSDV
jgi:hypothetical protein